jgi:hypothetical protein
MSSDGPTASSELQQVEVIGHQHVRVQRAAKALRKTCQVIKKELIVLVSEEARLTIVPALNHVHGNTGSLQALATRHGASRNSYSMPPQRTAPERVDRPAVEKRLTY